MILELPPHPNLDSSELDTQYNNRAMVPEYIEMYEMWEPLSTEIFADFPSYKNIAYGTSPRETLDIVSPREQGPHPALLYIHGGYWMSRTKSDQTFLARAYAEAGIAFVLLEYDLIPEVRMGDIVHQCRTAVRWVHKHASNYDLDPDQIFISGHSAGGHLTAILAATNSSVSSDTPENPIKGGVALSGIYDLKPVQCSYMQETLALTDEEIVKYSPQLFNSIPSIPLIIAPGSAESDAFRYQSANLVNTWNAKGANCRYMEIAGCNHFSILAEFADPNSALAEATIELINKNA